MVKVLIGTTNGKVKMWTALKEWQQESYESGYTSGQQAGYKSGEKPVRRLPAAR